MTVRRTSSSRANHGSTSRKTITPQRAAPPTAQARTAYLSRRRGRSRTARGWACALSQRTPRRTGRTFRCTRREAPLTRSCRNPSGQSHPQNAERARRARMRTAMPSTTFEACTWGTYRRPSPGETRSRCRRRGRGPPARRRPGLRPHVRGPPPPRPRPPPPGRHGEEPGGRASTAVEAATPIAGGLPSWPWSSLRVPFCRRPDDGRARQMLDGGRVEVSRRGRGSLGGLRATPRSSPAGPGGWCRLITPTISRPACPVPCLSDQALTASRRSEGGRRRSARAQIPRARASQQPGRGLSGAIRGPTWEETPPPNAGGDRATRWPG